MLAKCRVCASEFRLFPSDAKRGKGQHCSRECRKTGHGYLNAKTHGLSRTRLYTIWSDMKNRCYCRTSRGYRWYGARGTVVCPEWRQSFEVFRDWATANGYAPDLELDRRDSGGNYEPGNCRWATRAQQMGNTRKPRNAKSSRFKGVSWCANARQWRAQAHQKRKPIHLGLFTDEVKAARAYDAKARELYGEFAHTNFKD